MYIYYLIYLLFDGEICPPPPPTSPSAVDTVPSDWHATRPYVALIACHSAREVASVYGSTSHADINTSCQLPPSSDGGPAKETKEVEGEKRSERSRSANLLLSRQCRAVNQIKCFLPGQQGVLCHQNYFRVETLAPGVKSGVKITTEDQITPTSVCVFFLDV